MDWNESGGSLLPANAVEDGFPDMRLAELLGYDRVENFGSGSGLGLELSDEWDFSKDAVLVVDDDVLDRLPTDPFEMDRRLSVSSWVRDFENYDKWGDESRRSCVDDHELFEELNRVWESNVWSESEVEVVSLDEQLSFFHLDDRVCGDFLEFEGSVESEVIVDEAAETEVVADEVKELRDCDKVRSNEGADIHEGFFFALAYLSVKDLLKVEQVCKTLRVAIRGDPLLWQNIRIDHPLHSRITDDALVQLTNRAQGTLRCLQLTQCVRITDNGLAQVLENNPRIVKLSVPGCVRLSAECILLHLRALRSAGLPGVRYLRVGEASHISNKQFEEFKTLVGADNHMLVGRQKPCFYSFDEKHLSFDDDRPLDVDICPRCQKVSPVYECPAASCQGENDPIRLCRACIASVARCCGCGKCIKGQQYYETMWFELLCLDCWEKFREQEQGV